MTAPIALVGSGEYLPVMTEIEAALIAGRPPRYVQLATAAAPEGQKSLDRWHNLGKAQADRLGVEQVVVDVRTRDDAQNSAFAAMIDGAGLIYLSGGNPAHLADTLRDTPVWTAIVAAHQAGAALAGCSAGAMALADWAPWRRRREGGRGLGGSGGRGGGTQAGTAGPTGLRLVPNIRVIPHFDVMGRRSASMLTSALATLPAGTTLVGIDEDTALVGGPHQWQVLGRQSVWIIDNDDRREYKSGSSITTP
jgi:cyanophycinase